MKIMKLLITLNLLNTKINFTENKIMNNFNSKILPKKNPVGYNTVNNGQNYKKFNAEEHFNNFMNNLNKK